MVAVVLVLVLMVGVVQPGHEVLQTVLLARNTSALAVGDNARQDD